MNEIPDVIVINMETLEAIFFKYFARLAYFAFQISKNRRKAKDTASDIFADLWGKKDHLEFKDYKALEAHLYAAMKQKLRAQFAIISQSELDKALVLTESVAFVNETLSDLPSKERSVMELLLFGKNTRQIAKKLRMSEDSVEANKFRGLALIKKKFGDKLF